MQGQFASLSSTFNAARHEWDGRGCDDPPSLARSCRACTSSTFRRHNSYPCQELELKTAQCICCCFIGRQYGRQFLSSVFGLYGLKGCGAGDGCEAFIISEPMLGTQNFCTQVTKYVEFQYHDFQFLTFLRTFTQHCKRSRA